jgi:dipeptidyl aminopeptidase/acylaminoacyl peptidase
MRFCSGGSLCGGVGGAGVVPRSGVKRELKYLRTLGQCILNMQNQTSSKPCHKLFDFRVWILFVALYALPRLSMGDESEIARWLSKAELAPPFVAPANLQEWENQRTEIKARVWQLLGKLPSRPKPLEVRTLSRKEQDGYTVEKFEFENGAGATVPGYLLLPSNRKEPAPAILYCHWHGGQYDIGKEELFQAAHTPEAPGPVLAKRGFAVLGIDAYCFGERNGRGPGEKGGAGELSASKFHLWVGRTLWGMILRDDLIALDYLTSRPEVNAKRIGVMGMSMGATRAWWLMALDERLQTGVPVCCLTRYQNLIKHDLLKAHGIYYYVPQMLNYFDTEAVVALIAPRPVLFLDGDRDQTSPVDGIHAIESAVRPVYKLYDKTSEFESVVYAGQGHIYTTEMWEKTLKWMERWLK